MSFQVFKIRYGPVMNDPDMPGKRYHTVIFVETNPTDGTGIIHHVTGDLVSGMRYERKPSRRPEESQTFHQREPLGNLQAATYPQSVDAILSQQRPPPAQKKFNIATMRTEPMRADGSFYQPGEPRAPLVKCTEWIENQAIPSLRHARVLGAAISIASASQESRTGSPGWIWYPACRRYGRQRTNGEMEWR